MASKRKFSSFRWKIFIPMLATMWVCVASLSFFKFRSIVTTNEEVVENIMHSTADDILNLYENNESAQAYLNFLDTYYDDTLFDPMQISVYKGSHLVFHRGDPIPMSMTETDNRLLSTDRIYQIMRNNNGGITLLQSLPRSVILDLGRSRLSFWIIVTILLLICLVVSYLLSMYFSHNIRVLSNFAERAAEGDEILEFDESEFTRDEIGDISLHIVRLYQDRLHALARIKREHELTIHAVEEKSRIKRQLTNNINHEIKTPVGVIRGYLDTVMSSPDMDESIRTQFLLRAQSNVKRLCDLLNDVSTMTRLEESGTNIPTTSINLHDFVLGIESDLNASGVLGNFTFTTHIPIDCVVRGNANLITGVITNLVRNAVQHSGGSAINLNTIIESRDFYTFAFEDNGVGVEDEHLSHIFERFYRVDAGRSRKAGGTGLGLSIVKNAIEAMGGSISVQRRTTGGLQFIFTLEKYSKVKKS